MMLPVNLYYNQQGQTVLRYWLQTGATNERVVAAPAYLLTALADAQAVVNACVLETPSAVLYSAFRRMPLCPEADWQLTGDAFSTLYQQVFEALVRMLRLPPSKRWCVRGEPGWFLQFGFQEADGSYTMGAFVLPCGKPAVLTFRAEDLIEALPPKAPFATMDIQSEADGLAAQMDCAQPWDTRIRLPIADNGAALVRLFPNALA